METEQLLQKVSELLQYNPETGKFTWLKNRGNGIKAGDVAGTVNKQGYVQISILNKLYLAHRLAYLVSYGSLPKGSVDHINRNREDNSLKNLRDVCQQLNSLNTKARGTHLSKDGWSAGFAPDGKRKHLGYFNSEVEAHNAYTKAKETYLERKYGKEQKEEL